MQTSLPNLLTHETLALALKETPSKQCTCVVGGCLAWQSSPDERWPVAQMQPIGTLHDPELCEPTFEQHHPDGTHYDADHAPISVAHFPFNRCDAFKCNACERVLLRYTEYGGYYVDHRVRWAQASLLN